MKLTLSILFTLGIILSLNASEGFPLIEPYAVEKAPIVTEVEAVAVVEEKPVVEEPVQEQTDTKAVEEVVLDDDKDGVMNDKDKCPNTSSEFMVDGYGCPQTMILNINFPSSKSNITDDLIDDLKEFAQFLQDNPGYQVIIYGYTDNSGLQEANKKLSQERANSVKDVLVRYDIDEIRLTAIGKGDADPIADNDTSEGRAQNRRIEIELIQ